MRRQKKTIIVRMSILLVNKTVTDSYVRNGPNRHSYKRICKCCEKGHTNYVHTIKFVVTDDEVISHVVPTCRSSGVDITTALVLLRPYVWNLALSV